MAGKECRVTRVLRELATVEESADALRRLSDADLYRLEQLARLRVTGLALDWGDLLNEAIVRMLDGSRRWPRKVPLVVFLRETMRSIASDHWRRLDKSIVAAESTIRADAETGDGGVEMAPDLSMEPEARSAAAETLACVEEAFRDDADALAVIVGMVCGQSPREIQEENAMNETRYASTQRRIRRGLIRAFPEGGETS